MITVWLRFTFLLSLFSKTTIERETIFQKNRSSPLSSALKQGGCWEVTHLQWLSFPKRWMPCVTFVFVLCNTSWAESSEVDAWQVRGTLRARRRIWLSCAAQLWTSPGDTMCTHRNIQAAPRVVEKYREAACTALLRSVHWETEGSGCSFVPQPQGQA